MEERHRIAWVTRVHVRPGDQEAIRVIAKDERTSMATLIGDAIQQYITARST